MKAVTGLATKEVAATPGDIWLDLMGLAALGTDDGLHAIIIRDW